MQAFINHQRTISVLLSNSASWCQALVQKVGRTVTTVNNATQPVCNVTTAYRHQRPDQLLNCQECQRHVSMLENESQDVQLCTSSVFLHKTSSSS